MSVAAMTMDDQRPLLNSYDKMSKQYEQNLHGHSGGIGGSAGGNGMGAGGAPPSGPASPTPSGSEELSHPYHHSHHHHSHHHHHHHPRHMHQHMAHSMSTSEHQPPSPPPPMQQQLHMHHHTPHHQLQQQQQQQLESPSTVAEAVAAAEHRQRLLEDEIESLKLEQTRLSQQCVDAQRREKILMRRLANKEQEFQDYVSQIAEYKAAQAPTALALRSALLDPAVNLLFEKLKKELKATKAKLEETQNELSAWKFTPDSNTGKRLIAKCRLLYQENEELGKMTSNGRLAKLETELAMQKSFCEEVKKSQSEVDDFLPELDEDVEGMQSTILFLQQELKTTRDRIQTLEKENYQLKTGTSDIESNVKPDLPEIDTNDSTLHSSLNGADAPVNMTINSAEPCAINFNNSAIPSNTNATNIIPTINNAAPHTQQANELKYNSAVRPLETIDENASARSTFAIPNEFYNGNDEQQKNVEYDSNTPINPFSANASTLASPAVLRTVATRKRNFECGEPIENQQSVMMVVAPATPTHVTAPRTLPPKKSKLRRSSVQSNDMNEYDAGNVIACGNAQILGGVGVSAVAGGNASVVIAAIDPLNIVDNAVVGMANEEHPTGMAIDESVMESNTGGVALRIMTRRRSVRQQQNGSIGGDSNH